MIRLAANSRFSAPVAREFEVQAVARANVGATTLAIMNAMPPGRS
jgi:hypothetical protein